MNGRLGWKGAANLGWTFIFHYCALCVWVSEVSVCMGENMPYIRWAETSDKFVPASPLPNSLSTTVFNSVATRNFWCLSVCSMHSLKLTYTLFSRFFLTLLQLQLIFYIPGKSWRTGFLVASRQTQQPDTHLQDDFIFDSYDSRRQKNDSRTRSAWN